MADLVTVPEVLTYLGLTSDPGSFLAGEATRVSAAIRKHCIRRPLGETPTKTEDLDGGHEELLLRFLPVVSVTSVTDKTDASVQASTERVLVAETGELLLADADGNPTGERWGAGARRWRVVYVAGVATVPDEVKEAALQLIAGAWQRRNPAQVSGSAGGVSSTFQVGMPLEVKRLLARHADVVI